MNKLQGEAMETTLRNEVILWRIFSFLKLKELKHCRLASKYWNAQVGSYIRSHRQCHVHIRRRNSKPTCFMLKALNEQVSQMPPVLIINSLNIQVIYHEKSNCTPNAPSSCFQNLFGKLRVTRLEISSRDRPQYFLYGDCPVVRWAQEIWSP